MAAERRVATLGGKGSALSSSTVFQVANSLSNLTVDPSALSRLSSPNDPTNFSFSTPDYLTQDESRASILLLLIKLLLSASSSPSAATQLADIIRNESNSTAHVIENVSVNDVVLFDYAAAAVIGISAILDHLCSVLSPISDAIAALSCEALRADGSVFNLIDSGDGSSSKDDVAVASDFKVFLNGSKLANGKFSHPAVCKIPMVHGNFREISRMVHLRAKVELNSGFRVGSSGSVETVSTVLSSLAMALLNLGELSFHRTKLMIDSLVKADELFVLFGNGCPSSDILQEIYVSAQTALLKKDYIKFAHDVHTLWKKVWRVVSWEAITGLISIEGSDFVGNSEENGKTDKKDEKKKKKVVLGKGTTALLQFVRDRLLASATDSTTSQVEKCAKGLQSLMDPKGPGFDSLLKKVKEIVESNESRRLPKLAKGTRDFAKEQMAIREKAFSIIVDVFKRHGATALDTPVFELRETLMGKYGEDSKLIYDLADQGGELCSLRYDLTVPFARYMAMNGLTSFKRYQIAKVYRRDNPSKGRYREFYQCDFDIAGQFEKMGADFEVIRILTELLDELNIGDYEVKLNHRKLLDGMFAICGVPAEKFRTICSSIDKLDKQSFEQIKKEMVGEKGLTNETADKIGTFVKERGPPLQLLAILKQEGSELLGNGDSLLALNELEILFKALEKSRCINKVVFDLSLARGLDYYTGVIFEAVFKGGVQVGSIAAGGRYDNLIGMFGTKQVPAVGVSLGIERVFAIMDQLQKDKQDTRATETQVLVSILGDDLSLGAEMVSELWDAKMKAEFMLHKKVFKHFDRAKNDQIPWIVIVGEREVTEGIVKLRDVSAAVDYVVPRDRLVEELHKRLNDVSP